MTSSSLRGLRLAYIANVRFPTEKAHGFQIAKMCEAFADAGADVTLLHPRRHQTDPALRDANLFSFYGVRRVFRAQAIRNVDVVPLSVRLPRALFVPIFFLHNVVWSLYAVLMARAAGCDLIYSRDSAATYWGALFGVPVAYEAHGVPKRGRRWLLAASVRSPAVRLVATVTAGIKERFAAMGVDDRRLLVAPDAVDLAAFEGLPTRTAARARLGLPADRATIGYVGRFHTLGMEKGIPELIEAMGTLCCESDRPPLLVCVGGPLSAVPTYRALAARHGVAEEHIRFVDRVPNQEVPEWIRAFDVAAAPFPDTEHYAHYMSPLKIFEYMASGTPIVATDLPSLREVLRDGESAVLVRPGDPKAIAEGLRRALDPSVGDCLAATARRDVERLTWLRRAEQILGALADQ